jgi:hypothetical protein
MIENMLIASRNPSTNWEPLPLEPSGQIAAWVWFRPGTIPTGLMFLVPAVVYTDPRMASRMTVRQLVAATGLDSGQICGWSVGGMSFDAAGGASPLLDQIVPSPANGGNLEVSVWMAGMTQPGWPSAAAYSQQQFQPTMTPAGPISSGVSALDAQLLEAIEIAWKDVLQLESRVATQRKELSSIVARLSSQNRDLTAHERLVCTSKDLQEWAEIRRALRDTMHVMARSIKEIDLGTTSGAGKRHRFNEIYQTYAVPRISFPGLIQAVNEFDTYRKILQSVISAAQAALARGSRDADMRASSFLQRVHAKAMSRRK